MTWSTSANLHPQPATLAMVVHAMESLYPPHFAEDWDKIGLATGDPTQPISKILVAVDPAPLVVQEAVAGGYDLLITHHPLLFDGVHSVATTSATGTIIHTLISNQIALFSAHTNADSARPGVNDALADLLGVRNSRPLDPIKQAGLTQLTFYTPTTHTDQLIDRLSEAGAGTVGEYRRCAFRATGTGTFTAAACASPTIGRPGERTDVAEDAVTMAVSSVSMPQVIATLRTVHPYEEPVYFVHESLSLPTDVGIGRIGTLDTPMSLAEFAQQVANVLPATAAGIQVGGDLDRIVRTVAVCGGAGDSVGHLAKGADVYVTSDYRHHRAQGFLDETGAALINTAHWASEWPWCPQVAQVLNAELERLGYPHQLRIDVSTLVTDPWVQRI